MAKGFASFDVGKTLQLVHPPRLCSVVAAAVRNRRQRMMSGPWLYLTVTQAREDGSTCREYFGEGRERERERDVANNHTPRLGGVVAAAVRNQRQEQVRSGPWLYLAVTQAREDGSTRGE